MLFVISPAKNLDFESPTPTNTFTQPTLLEYSQTLIDICKVLSPQQIATLMGLSDKLAGLNAARFGEWQQPFTLENARQAIFAFNGDVYTGLDAYSLTDENISYAQKNLRILSGLYGLLKPLDLMQAYRLEMGTKLANNEGSNLYHFWGQVITDELNQVIEETQSKDLINLASNEYFKSVKIKSLNANIITPQFKDWKNGQYKIISFYAKKARGLMARYMIENEVDNIESLLNFNVAGYEYNEELSTKLSPVFTRQLD